MTDSQQSLVRSVLKIGSGVLVAKGFADESTAEVIVAGLVALFAVIWGLVHRVPAAQAKADENGSEGEREES